jgi:hypothetical protein
MEFLRRTVYLSKYFRPYDSDGDGVLDSLILSATTKTLQIPLIQKFDDIGIYRTLDPMVEDVEIIDIDNLWSTSNDGRGDVDYTEVGTQSSATNQGDEGSVNQEGTNTLGAVCTDGEALNYILNDYPDATLTTNSDGDPVLKLSSGEELLYTSCSNCCNLPSETESPKEEPCEPDPIPEETFDTTTHDIITQGPRTTPLNCTTNTEVYETIAKKYSNSDTIGGKTLSNIIIDENWVLSSLYPYTEDPSTGKGISKIKECSDNPDCEDLNENQFKLKYGPYLSGLCSGVEDSCGNNLTSLEYTNFTKISGGDTCCVKTKTAYKLTATQNTNGVWTYRRDTYEYCAEPKQPSGFKIKYKCK